ncbi:hypothetical protein BJV78DRAFT_1285152 [Lactifluus subvellereus]|nr:hypothetical protein BJV78DRAFT_1285152 [Lactifluus subvellereus]
MSSIPLTDMGTAEQGSQTDSSYVYGPDAFFSMYLEKTEEEDTRMVETWKTDADGTLVFTGLFSAAVATCIGISIQDLKPNPQDTSAIHLGNIYQLLADPNRTHISIPSTLSTPPPFSPPKYIVWVNALWFLSFSVSLTCALLATLLQRWARRYLRITRLPYRPHRRARIRAFFFEGIHKLHLPWVVEALPTLLHLSLFLFFAGLGLYLHNINHTIFVVVLSWAGVCITAYAIITLMPILRHNSPYYAPLSSSAWCLVNGLLYVIFRFSRAIISLILDHQNVTQPHDWETTSYKKFSDGMDKTAEQTAQEENLLQRLDLDILSWMFKTLDEDHEWERCFVGLASACSSRVMHPRRIFVESERERLKNALMGWAERTLSSNLVSEEIKERRINIYINTAIDTTVLQPSDLIHEVLHGKLGGFLSFVAFGLSAQIWLQDYDPLTTFLAECAIAATIARVQRWKCPGAWSHLVLSSQLDLSLPEGYVEYGDSALLANLISIVGQMRLNHSRLHQGFDLYAQDVIRGTLQLVCKFDAWQTLPELQYRFCDLWNELVDTAQNGKYGRTRQFSIMILKNIRKVMIELCKGEDAPLTGQMNSIITSGDDDSVLEVPSSYSKCQTRAAPSFPLPPMLPSSYPTRTVLTASPTPYDPREAQHNMQSSMSSFTPPPPSLPVSTIVAPTSVQYTGAFSRDDALPPKLPG